jgi:telomere length regulation protein
MATDLVDNTLTEVRELINRLQSPVPDLSTLLALLSCILDDLGLLPPQFRRYNVNPLPDGVVSISRHIPPLQRALLEHIVPTWGAVLAEQNATLLVEQYFCPDPFLFASSAAGDVVLLAYSTILSQQLTEDTIHLLVRLSTEYPIDRLHSAVFSGRNDASSRQLVGWEDCVRNIVMVPAKVANAVGGKGEIPPLLEHGTYFNNVCVRCESLISSLSVKSSRGMLQSIMKAYILSLCRQKWCHRLLSS